MSDRGGRDRRDNRDSGPGGGRDVRRPPAMGISFPLIVPRHPAGESLPTASEQFQFQVRSCVDVTGKTDGLYACLPLSGGGYEWVPWLGAFDPVTVTNLHVLGDADIDDDLNVDGDAVIDGSVTLGGLAGVGSRPVVADASGVLGVGGATSPGTIDLLDGNVSAATAVGDIDFTPAASWTVTEPTAGHGRVAPIFGTSANTFLEGTHAAVTTGVHGITTFTATILDDTNAAGVIATLGLDADIATLALPASTTISTFGASLIDDAAATNARTTLGLVIGTDVQAQDAELAAIAGLTSAADRLPYFTGSGTASLATFTTAGRAIVDDADATAQRATLGLGSIATQAASAVAITGGSVTGITDITLADGGTGASLTDPNADRILFWDDSAGAMTWLTPGSNLLVTGTTIDAGAASSDWTLITSANFTAQPSVSINNCFSATYRNYKIIIDVDSASSAGTMNVRLRLAGADTALANYDEFLLFGSSAAVTLGSTNVAAGTSWVLGSFVAATCSYGLLIDLQNPFGTIYTTGMGKASYRDAIAGPTFSYFDAGIGHRLNISYDGFTFYPSAGNFTGRYMVYAVKD